MRLIYQIISCFVFQVCFLFPNNSYADFRVCNVTKSLIGVAIGYASADGWVTEGWWQVAASTCATLLQGDLSSRYYYLYAEDANRGEKWVGDINMCIAQNEFKIVGVKDCYTRGYQKARFKEYDTGRHVSWTVQLSDISFTQKGSH